MDTHEPLLKPSDASFVAGISRSRLRNLLNGGTHRAGERSRAKGEWRRFRPSEVFSFALANAACNEGLSIGVPPHVGAAYLSWVLLSNPESAALLRKGSEHADLNSGSVWQSVLGRYAELADRMAEKSSGLARAKAIREYVQAQRAKDLV